MVRATFAFLLAGFLVLAACQGPAGSAPASAASREAAYSADFRLVINKAKDKVFPAVVFIRVVSEGFEGGKKVSHEAAGSGVLITPQGQVLTNWHVIDKAVEVRCLLYDGEALEATVLGSDKDSDLALLQLKRPANAPALPYAVLGDSSKLTEGDFVMAMGAPWGLSRSVSLGIISCTKRYLPGASEYSAWLQTDASISPGNSGGPLVNTAGEVIGINARGMSNGGELGFAIPAETVALVVPQLRASGKVNWSWTGLQLQPIKDFNRNIYFDGTDGVIVADTDPESPARRAGILPRDRILEVNGRKISGLMEEDLPPLRRLLGLLPRTTAATLEIQRGTQLIPIKITPREKGKVEGEALDCPRWDLTVKTINQFDNPDLYSQKKQGVFIYGVKTPGNAYDAQLQTDDILLKIDGKSVATLDDIKAIHKASLDRVLDNPRLLITVLRNGLMQQKVLDISRDYSSQ